MKIFLAIKYNKDSLELVPDIKGIIEKSEHTIYCFATDEPYIKDTKEMMRKAFEKIDESDLVIVESSNIAFGVGIEAGYAFAKNKKIITIVNKSAENSSTLKGISESYIIYSDFTDLKIQLQKYLIY